MISLSRLKNHLCSAHLTFYTLPYIMILVVIGTLLQASMGLYDAANLIFYSWVIWVEFVPVPGGMLAMSLFTLNLLMRFIFKSEWTIQKSGIHITHLGILILLFGAAYTHMTARDGYMVMGEDATSNIIYAYNKGELNITPPDENGTGMQWGETMATLPFSMTLDTFVRQDYAGTRTPKDYHSDITITENDLTFPVRIALNKPLNYRGYNFYQSSFIEIGDKKATILQVSKNKGALTPYIASLLIALGLLIHLIFMTRQRHAS